MTQPAESFVKPNTWIFLTGGSGFLGRQLIVDLVTQGFRVRALARSPAARDIVQKLGAEPFAGDLNHVPTIVRGMQGCEVIIHSAAKVEIWGDWEDFERVTVKGTENIIQAAREAGLRRLIHISTEAVLADGKALINVDESRPLPAKPNGMYPRSKGMAEQRVLAANDNGLFTVVVRPRFIWGRGDTTLLPNLVKAMKNKSWAWFGPDHLMSTCHVANVSHGVILATKFGRAGQIYFLTDGESISFRDFITRMMATQNVKVPPRQAPLWLASIIAALSETSWRLFKLNGMPPMTRTTVNLFLREVTVSDTKARRELGYTPVISLDEGLRQLTQREPTNP